MFHKNYIQIYKGKQFYKPPPNFIKKKSKVIIFDLDETLGSFSDLEILWSGIMEYNKNNNIDFQHDEEFFHRLFDLYPEFLRYGILNILEYLQYKKNMGDCDKVYLYTNNQLPKSWTKMIIHYLEKKQNCLGLFDELICAFKINKKIIEPKRTTNMKTYSDFIRCSLLSRNTELCFVDNTYFEKMKHEKVYYIQPKPYYHSLVTSDIIDRFISSSLHNFQNDEPNKIDYKDFLYLWFVNHNILNTTNKSVSEIERDLIVSQKMMYYIQEFFYLTTKKNKTQKIRPQIIGRFTKKNRELSS